MAQQQPHQQQNNQQKKASKNPPSTNQTNGALKKPMIVDRVNKIPMVNFAISMGFSQYDKLKTSNITVGDVMTKAESWALFVWSKVAPIVDKLQDPINKADQLACQTFDFVEDKLSTVQITASPLTDTILKKFKPVTASSES